MKDIKAIIFDMDGVIFDTESVYLKVWSEVFEKYGYKMTKEIYASVIGTGNENVRRTYLKHFGKDLPIDEMYREKDENLVKAIDNGVPMKEGALEMLKHLKDNNYKIAMATSGKSTRALKHLKEWDIVKYFDAIVCREEVKETKPNPEIFLKAAQKLDIEPKQCIVIEDSAAGIKAAFNAGMTPIHVVDLKEADDDIIKNCYKSFNSLNEAREGIQILSRKK